MKIQDYLYITAIVIFCAYSTWTIIKLNRKAKDKQD